MDSACVRGSMKCRSTMQSGGGRKGFMRTSSRPNSRSIFRGKSSPKRAAKRREDRAATSPSVLRPARRKACKRSSSISSAASERRAAAAFWSSAKNAAGGKARQRAGAIRRSGHSGPGGKSLLVNILQHAGEKTLLAAEQMGAAGDVEHQPMRFVQRRQRRIALATRRQTRQDLGVRRTVDFLHDELRQTRPRIRQRQAGNKSLAKGGGVERAESLGVLLLFDQCERRFVIRRGACSPATFPSAGRAAKAPDSVALTPSTAS